MAASSVRSRPSRRTGESLAGEAAPTPDRDRDRDPGADRDPDPDPLETLDPDPAPAARQRRARRLPAPLARAARPLPAAVDFDWERLVGVKLYSWIAGVAVAIAAVSFVRYSVEHGWLVPSIRLAIGTASGLALLLGAETRAARRYAITAQALAAGGTITLFATFWAAHTLWHLVPALATFGLLALVAAVAVLLALRREALVVAVLGLAGGFATPWLLSTGEDRPLGLFSYLLLLNLGLAWVARKKRWPVLSAVALGATALYQAGWVWKFLDEPGELPVAVAVFLVFPLVGFAGLALAARRDEDPSPLARWTAALGAVPPVLFAIYVPRSPPSGAPGRSSSASSRSSPRASRRSPRGRDRSGCTSSAPAPPPRRSGRSSRARRPGTGGPGSAPSPSSSRR